MSKITIEIRDKPKSDSVEINFFFEPDFGGQSPRMKRTLNKALAGLDITSDDIKAINGKEIPKKEK